MLVIASCDKKSKVEKEVADEVRALAHRTQQSTEEIEQMIGGIRHDTDEAVTAMHSSNSLASATLDVARSAGEALHPRPG